MPHRHLWLVLLVLAVGGCPGPSPSEPPLDGGSPDAGSDVPDAGTDTPDAGGDEGDAGSDAPDAGSEVPDAGEEGPDAGSDSLPLGLLPDGGDAARLPDGGWDDGYQPAPLGTCTDSATVVVASVPDVDCFAGLLDGQRVVLAARDWPSDGGHSSDSLPAPMRLRALGADGGVAIPERALTGPDAVASCLGTPVLSQLGGRYALAYTGYSPSSSLERVAYPPLLTVLAHDLSPILGPRAAGEAFVRPPGVPSTSPVETWSLSLQAAGDHFRLGFLQLRALYRDPSTGQVFSGFDVRTTSSAPGPGAPPGSWDQVLASDVSPYGAWALAEAQDGLYASYTTYERTLMANTFREERPAGAGVRVVPAVDGGVLVSDGPPGPLALAARPDGGATLVYADADGGTVLQTLSPDAQLGPALAPSAPWGVPHEGEGQRVLVGLDFDESTGTPHARLVVTRLDEEGTVLQTRRLALPSSAPHAHVLDVDLRADRVRVLTAVYTGFRDSGAPVPGELLVSTLCF